jgi:hypothetical protein
VAVAAVVVVVVDRVVRSAGNGVFLDCALIGAAVMRPRSHPGRPVVLAQEDSCVQGLRPSRLCL